MLGWIIAGCSGLIVFLLSQLIGAIWWMATITSNLRHIEESLKEFLRTNEKRGDKFEAEINALWKNIDSLKGTCPVLKGAQPWRECGRDEQKTQ